jgi:hypothetical protein
MSSFYDFNTYVELEALWSVRSPEEYADLKAALSILRNTLQNSLNIYENADEDFKLAFRILFNSFMRSVESLIKILKLSSNCDENLYGSEYYLGGPVNEMGSPLLDSSGKPILDSVVRKIDTVKNPNSRNCPFKYVLVPKRINGRYDFTSGYNATEGFLETSINMELLEDSLNINDPNLTSILKNIITNIIGQTTITEFTITGENNRPILSSNPSQPPSTYAYGGYNNLKTAITDRYLKLNLKIHNPTQAFKITHLINVPQTYTNCYAQKEPNYEKI